jgi:hypothetical protein
MAKAKAKPSIIQRYGPVKPGSGRWGRRMVKVGKKAPSLSTAEMLSEMGIGADDRFTVWKIQFRGCTQENVGRWMLFKKTGARAKSKSEGLLRGGLTV